MPNTVEKSDLTPEQNAVLTRALLAEVTEKLIALGHTPVIIVSIPCMGDPTTSTGVWPTSPQMKIPDMAKLLADTAAMIARSKFDIVPVEVKLDLGGSDGGQ